MIKYRVMVLLDAGTDAYVEEYSGHSFNTKFAAADELEEAKELTSIDEQVTDVFIQEVGIYGRKNSR